MIVGVVSPQFANTPFTATVKAKDAQDQLVESFNGSATLGAWVKSPDVTVGSGVISSLYPLATFSHDARCQAIYLAAELGGAKPLTALALEVTGVPGQTLNNWTIRMKHTALASFTTPNWESTGWTVVYQNDETLQGTGWVNFAFSAPFNYNGTSHLMIDFSFKNTSYTYDGECRASVTSQPRSLQGSSDSAWGDPLAWTGANNPPPLVDNQIPNIKLLSTPAALAMTPVNIGPFTNGVWSGKLIMSATATNVGLIVDDGAGHLGFGNDFNVLANSRPVLGSVFISGNNVTLSWSAIAGRIYRVQFKDDLSALSWSNLPGDVMTTNTTGTKADNFGDSPHRFYRILLLP